METLRSPTLGSSGGPLGTERAPISPGLTRRTDELFRDEVAQALERSGGRRELAERAEGLHRARRTERHAGFERYQEGRSDPAERGPRDVDRTPAAAVPTARSSELLSADVASLSRELGEGPSAAPGAPLAADAREQASVASAARGSANLPSTPTTAPASGPTPTTPLAGAGATSAPNGRAAAATPSFGPVSPPSASAARPGENARAPVTAEPGSSPDPAHVERAAEVLRQIRASLTAGARHLTLHLMPAELGRLSIHVALRRGKLAGVVRAESPETLELLQRHVPELRAALEERGLEPESFQLHLGFGDPEAGERDGFGRRFQNAITTTRRTAPTSTPPASVDAVSAQASPVSIDSIVSIGGVDTFA